MNMTHEKGLLGVDIESLENRAQGFSFCGFHF